MTSRSHWCDIVQGVKAYAALELECQDLRARLVESKKIIKNLSVTELFCK